MPKPTLLHRVAAFIAALYLHLVGKTSFVETWDHPSYLPYRRKKKPMIFGFWHNAQVFLSYHHRHEPINIMVSQSKDGEYIARVMAWLGVTAIRGSSSRGGLKAFVELMRQAEAGEQIGFTPDGPRGPAHVVQDGIILAAKKLGAPIVPLHSLSRRRMTFNTWDKFMVPLPFSTMAVAHGRPFVLTESIPEETAREKVKDLLNKNERVCEEAVHSAPSYGQNLGALTLLGIYNVFMHVLVPFWVPVVFFQYGFKRSVSGLGERLGFSKPAQSAAKRLWFHAASLGEWQALKPFLKPVSVDAAVLITTSSPEARDLIRKEEPGADVYLIPTDIPWVISAWIGRWSPDAVFIVETELWPNLVEACYNKFIPIFIINGRLSAKSVHGWRRAKWLMTRLLRRVSGFYVRTDDDAARFKTLGAPAERIQVVGNLKVDTLFVLSAEQKKEVRRLLWGEIPGTILVAGSTWETEEEMVLKILAAPGCEKVRLVIVPRRQKRFEEVAKILERRGVSFERWSKIRGNQTWNARVLLVDTLGDLKKMYEASDVAFIGGSLKRGGQNPLEAAAGGNPLVFGVSMENFSAEAKHLVAAGAAFHETSPDGIVSSLTKLVVDAPLRRGMGQKAAQAVRASQGVTAKILTSLQEQMEILS